MVHPLHTLSVAEEASGAARDYLPLFPHCFRTAIGAFAVKGPYLTRIIAREVIHDLRNDIACPLHDNAVALPQAQPSDLVHVVEGHVGYDHSAHRNGLKPPPGGDFASAPDPRADPEQGPLRPFRGTFMPKRPARPLPPTAQPRPPIHTATQRTPPG